MRWVFLFCSSVLFACTDFVVQAQDGAYVNGRSLDFILDLQSKLKVFPRNQKMSSQSPDGKKGIEWTSRYGYVGAIGLGKNFPFDGLNEAGLSLGVLWLANFTEYPTVAPDEMRKALDFVDVGAWILGSFATVAEVKEGLKNVRIWGHPVPPLPGIPPIHFAVHDVKGNHLVVEFVQGQMKVYDNPFSVLTNAPPFDWQLTNLQNYLHLDAMNVEPIQVKGKTLLPTGEGTGMLGIPGDWTPPSRFVKIFTLLRFVETAAEANDAVNLAAHLLNAIDIPKGIIQQREGINYTQWAVIKDLTNRIFYFRSYGDLALKKIELKNLRFDNSEAEKNFSIDMKKGIIDVTPFFKGKNALSVKN